MPIVLLYEFHLLIKYAAHIIVQLILLFNRKLLVISGSIVFVIEATKVHKHTRQQTTFVVNGEKIVNILQLQ